MKKIKYYDGGVEVTAENMKTNNSQVIHKGEKAISLGESLGRMGKCLVIALEGQEMRT